MRTTIPYIKLQPILKKYLIKPCSSCHSQVSEMQAMEIGWKYYPESYPEFEDGWYSYNLIDIICNLCGEEIICYLQTFGLEMSDVTEEEPLEDWLVSAIEDGLENRQKL